MSETFGRPPPPMPAGMDPAFLALSLLRRRRLDQCIEQCTEMLTKNPYDLQVWYVKTRALTLDAWIDDTEVEEDGVAEVLLEDNAVASAPRPGTSLARPMSMMGGSRAGGRPVSTAGGGPRPQSGFARPGTNSGRSASRAGGVEGAFHGARPGTMRPVTTSGRFVRLGTASLANQPVGGEGGGNSNDVRFIDTSKMDLAKYATRGPLAKVLCDYILYVDRNPKVALDLCAYATEASKFSDWWWKARLGKCYYQLGLLREAEQQFKSSLKQQENIVTVLELGKVYHKLDQPLTSLELFTEASNRNPRDHHLLLGIARIHDMLNDSANAVAFYTGVLELDASNVEAIACIGSSYFHNDQPEIALRTYRRLLQMGGGSSGGSAELWNNLGLSCYYSSQYDMALSCMHRALALANDVTAADVWYNIGHISLGIGDVNMAYQAFKITVSLNPQHAEAFNNLGILELRKGNVEMARNNLTSASDMCSGGSGLAAIPTLHEPFYNLALMYYKSGEYQQAFQHVAKALACYPEHCESLELRKMLTDSFNAL